MAGPAEECEEVLLNLLLSEGSSPMRVGSQLLIQGCELQSSLPLRHSPGGPRGPGGPGGPRKSIPSEEKIEMCKGDMTLSSLVSPL